MEEVGGGVQGVRGCRAREKGLQYQGKGVGVPGERCWSTWERGVGVLGREGWSTRGEVLEYQGRGVGVPGVGVEYSEVSLKVCNVGLPRDVRREVRGVLEES